MKAGTGNLETAPLPIAGKVALVSNDPNQLADAKPLVVEWLWKHRRLRLKHPNSPVRSTRRRLSYLGHEVDQGQIEVGLKARKRAHALLAEHLVHSEQETFDRALESYRGILLGPVNLGGKRS